MQPVHAARTAKTVVMTTRTVFKSAVIKAITINYQEKMEKSSAAVSREKENPIRTFDDLAKMS